jgi:hypothetical protein
VLPLVAIVLLLAANTGGLPPVILPCDTCTTNDLTKHAPQPLTGQLRGLVQRVFDDRLLLFDPKTHQTSVVFFSAGFRNVDSNDGVLHHVPIARAKPLMAALVTYRIVRTRMVATHVELLTASGCLILQSAETRLHQPPSCPD